MSFGPDDAERLMLARERRADVLAPSPRLQSLASLAAEAAGVEADCVRKLDDDGEFLWHAIVRTKRGQMEREVQIDHRGLSDPDPQVIQRLVDDAWEDAFRDLGLLP